MKTLVELEDEFNSHPRESTRLILLCDNNLLLVELTYLALQKTFTWNVPGTKEELNDLLVNKLFKKLKYKL